MFDTIQGIKVSNRYIMSISLSKTDSLGLVLSGVLGSTGDVLATVSGHEIHIPQQETYYSKPSDKWSLSGLGTISGNTLTFSYHFVYPLSFPFNGGKQDDAYNVGVKQ